MLKKAMDLSKDLVKVALPNGKDVFDRYMENGIEPSSVKAKVNVVVNEDYSVSIVAEKDGSITYNVIGANGSSTPRTENLSITDELKQKIDNKLYIVKALPLYSYICVDSEGVFWGMSMINTTINLSKLGKFDNLLDHLDSPNWSVLDTVDDYFMYDNGYVGFVGNAASKSYKTDNLVCEFTYSDGDYSEAGVVFLDANGIAVRLSVDADCFNEYLEDNGLNRTDFVLI